MITGKVSSELRPQVLLTLVGGGGNEVEILAEIDTAFTGYLSIPRRQFDQLGWSLGADDNVMLGDGSEAVVSKGRGIVMWMEQPRIVDVHCFEVQPLLGRGMLHGCTLAIDFRTGGDISIRPSV